jgi:transmembrane sensor
MKPTFSAPGARSVSLVVKISISILVPGLLLTTYWSSLPPLLAVFSDHPVTYCAPLGDHITVTLPDGSIAEVNSKSCVTVDYSLTQRLVDLTGEAVFTVAHDPHRPFIVAAGHVRAQALGTRYDVYRKETDTEVSVFEGTVQVSAPGVPTQSLSALHEIDVPDAVTDASVLKRMTPDDIDQRTAWMAGHLVFNNQTMKDILTEFGRYQDFKVQTEDPQILALRLSGVFKTTDVTAYLSLLTRKCIRGDLDVSKQLLTLSRIQARQPGGNCSS